LTRRKSSPAFVRQPEGNGIAERVIRTLKEQLLWVRYFPTVEALRKERAEFADLCNAWWLRERHGHKTPNQIGPNRRPLHPKPPRSSNWRHNRRSALSHNRALVQSVQTDPSLTRNPP
jgi:hypothetical protein